MSGPGPFVKEPKATSRQLRRTWGDQPGWIGRITTVQNDIVGKRLLFCGFFFLLLGGSVDSVIMRIQLAVPDNNFVSPQLYNELFTNHGSVTMFLVVLPIIEGFTILVLPFMLGSREMPFPRLGAYSFYTFLMGGLFYYSSALFGLVPDAGWFAYTPLSGNKFSPDLALDFWVLGLSVAEVGAIAAAIEIVIAILKMRTPGMTLSRMPLFAWAMLVTSIMILFAFTPLIVGSLLLELDRGFDMKFFVPEAGGSSLLWQHIFWIFGHPEVYIQYLPAVGVVATVLPVFTRRKIAGYSWMVGGFISIGFLSFALWVHHMFTVGLPPIVESLFSSASMLIAIPAGVQIVALVLTIWLGRPIWKTPFLFVVGFLLTFVIGGITGVMVAAVPFDDQAHDSYFVVGHLHYVLIGGVAFPMFAAAYYWLPKFSGRLLNERLGRINFWLLFIGMNVAFFPMHIVGLMGMPRRVYTYPAESGWGIYNFISTIGVFVMLAGIATFLVNVVHSRFRGERCGADPWEADTLEWSVASPPPEQGFSVQPIVHGRHPLWDQLELHEGRPAIEKLLTGLSQWPTTWRAALVTNTTTAEPEEVFRPSGPSIWPFLTACATVGIFSGELIGQRAVVAAGVVGVLVGIARWHAGDEAPDVDDELAAFEAEHGVPMRPHGSRAISLAAMVLVITGDCDRTRHDAARVFLSSAREPGVAAADHRSRTTDARDPRRPIDGGERRGHPGGGPRIATGLRAIRPTDPPRCDPGKSADRDRQFPHRRGRLRLRTVRPTLRHDRSCLRVDVLHAGRFRRRRGPVRTRPHGVRAALDLARPVRRSGSRLHDQHRSISDDCGARMDGRTHDALRESDGDLKRV